MSNEAQVERDLIFDLGLHKGEDTEFYLKLGFRVVAVEAVNDFCDYAAKQFRESVNSQRLMIENVAITADGRDTEFFLSSNSVWGTTNREWAERNDQLGHHVTSKVVVRGSSTTDLIKKYGVPYYIKIDIEGADRQVLNQLGDCPVKPSYISIESEKINWKSLCHEFDLLCDLGYETFWVVPQQFVPRQKLPTPSREAGMTVDHTFANGASGTFGRDLPGVALTRKQALRKYRLIFLRYRLFGDSGLLERPGFRRVSRLLQKIFGSPGWYDTHAKHADAT